MRIFAPLTLAVGLSLAGVGSPAAASTEATPFPVCQDIEVRKSWVGAVCADPGNRACVVYGGGYVWNMCVINPL